MERTNISQADHSSLPICFMNERKKGNGLLGEHSEPHSDQQASQPQAIKK